MAFESEASDGKERGNLRSDSADHRTEWAEERTDWAEDRTILANERTFAAWMRTGLACLGVAIAVEAIYKETDPTWLAKSAASVFAVTGIFVFIAAYVKSRKAVNRLKAWATNPQPMDNLLILTILSVFGALGVAVLLWWI